MSQGLKYKLFDLATSTGLCLGCGLLAMNISVGRSIASQFDLPPAPISDIPDIPISPSPIPDQPLPPIYAQDINEQTNIRVYEIASPAVVSIQSGRGNGSGTIIDPKGLVLTSAHVVRTAQKVTVRLLDDRQFDGQVIASSRDPDLALIRLDRVTEPLPHVELISSANDIKVGQRAFAIGNPFGRFAGTLTTGIVSRLDRDRHLIQTDAAINPGNSGGPLLNSRGQLIGVNSAIFTARGNEGSIGLGFAIAADPVKDFVAAALSGQIGIDRSFKPPINLALNGRASRAALTASDETLPDGSFYKAFTFNGTSGQKVNLQMRSNEIDSYMILLDGEGNKIAEDDDGGSGNDASITLTLPKDGNYVVYANTYDVGEIGNFTISAQPLNINPNRSIPPSFPNSNTPRNSASAFSPAPNVILQRRGILGPGSRVLARDGSLFEAFSFEGIAGQVVEITLASEDFRPYLVLFSPQKQVIEQNSGITADRQNAAITLELPQTGTYGIVANTYDQSGRGEYVLTVKSLQ
ncbi:peptidase S1 and S6 chymotrypsin/Hap [Thalassoporum mexicanum PCC 7367]|uniref:trypsin-like peptidase domain-containing protein n=1 Tax=Thalassoporum mexicanum TaxID=3457544 RepID=UPI00029FF35A|nr:trypsin-like peptidase domain-containing protein [Pseudanabaena sp. PCC 7367]AFY70380.1 peptidase S1 and S6 chymotrypsin/Hap [Pseudanabaena sp. PCC 7367]